MRGYRAQIDVVTRPWLIWIERAAFQHPPKGCVSVAEAFVALGFQVNPCDFDDGTGMEKGQEG
jgi:hypothetical protein